MEGQTEKTGLARPTVDNVRMIEERAYRAAFGIDHLDDTALLNDENASGTVAGMGEEYRARQRCKVEYTFHLPRRQRLGEGGSCCQQEQNERSHGFQALSNEGEFRVLYGAGYRQARQDMIDVAWDRKGLHSVSEDSDVLIVIDVLSFTTSVAIAVSRGATVFPCRWRDEGAAGLASEHDAELALGRGRGTRWSLSPSSLVGAPEGLRIVLPSLNGSTLTMEASTHGAVFAGCLRNATVTAHAAQASGQNISVVAAGERWTDDGSLRPCLEDWVGAGAIVHQLTGPRSAEARVAEAAFIELADELESALLSCPSGRELMAKGCPGDVHLAAQLDVADAVAVRLVDGAYVACP